jgi:hypothetical protein
VVIVPLWEWEVVREERSNPVGVSMTRDGAMAALSRALLVAGHHARGNVRELALVDAAQEKRYLRFPIYRIAVCEHGVIRWERPRWRGRQQIYSSVTGRGGQALCGV